MTERHKVFVSYHNTNDKADRERFERLFADIYDIIVPKSVQIGDIDSNLPAERIIQIIRDEYLRDTTVTVVLVGVETWKRKHVDWEIGASIRHTQYSPRSGLLGILLPSYHNYYSIKSGKYNPCTIPPRLNDNLKCRYGKMYEWSNDPHEVQKWINEAFKMRNQKNPDNSYPSYKNNRSGERWC
ncbi:hypothetical protein IPdc08_00934 [archaeon]|nr:hypothetical protein IPdc08_00934 [archaeon]